MNTSELDQKQARLVDILSRLQSLLVAFSGGVDSAFLLAVAHNVLGSKIIAVTMDSPIHSRRERQAAIDFAAALGVEHMLLPSNVLDQPDFRENHKDRCYFCKKRLFKELWKIASQRGIKSIAHGANLDDLDDFRPGMVAARDMKVAAPLLEAGMRKQDIRRLSKAMGLSTWDLPSQACLASRIPYGNLITRQALRMVEDAEEFLRRKTFGQCRVRHHGNVARIEIDAADFAKILDAATRKAIVTELQRLGFSYVALDLTGYVQGSLNRVDS